MDKSKQENIIYFLLSKFAVQRSWKWKRFYIQSLRKVKEVGNRNGFYILLSETVKDLEMETVFMFCLRERLKIQKWKRFLYFAFEKS